MRFFIPVFAVILAGSSFSCKKDDKIEVPQVVGAYVDTLKTYVDTNTILPKLQIKYVAYANTKTLTPVTKMYTNSSGDFFSVDKFNFYISNVQLRRQDGSWYKEPESYHLVKMVDGKTSFTINDLPVGDYSAIKYLIGVDSLRNVSGSQTGDLAQNQDMFWDWNSGYIFFKLEGTFASQASPQQQYAMHIGGFQGPNSCLQSVTSELPSAINAKKGRVSVLENKVTVDEIFKNPKDISFDYYYGQVTTGPAIFREISINYADMITPDKISN